MNQKLAGTIAILWACNLSASAFALPSFSRVVSGEATFLWSTDTLTVTTNGDTTIEWNTFDLAGTEHLYFNQATASNWVQNTVLVTAPVQILGTITSNGGWGITATELVMNGSIAAHSVALVQGSSLPVPLPSSIPAAIPIDVSSLLMPSGAVTIFSGRDISLWPSFNVGGGGVPIFRPPGGAIRIYSKDVLEVVGGPLVPSGGSITLVSSVPEAETYAMLLTGLAWIGVVVRRRNQR